MRKLIVALSILAFLLILAPVFHAQTVTPNLNLNLPPLHSVNWGTLLNANFTKLDSYLSGGTALPPGFWSANHATSTLYGTVLLNSGPTNTTAENSSNKGILNGYAPLDANVLVPIVNLPAVSSTQNGILSSTDYNRFNAGILLFPGNAALFLNGTGVFTAVPGACSNNCTFTGTTVLPTATISGGTIDGTVIGGTTPAAGSFTSLSATSLSLASIDGTVIGGTTPAAGHFTTLSTTGLATLNSLSTASATVTGGAIDATPIGSTTPSTGAFTTLNGTTITASTGFSGNGASITALNGANISTGNIAAARINNALTAPGPIGSTTPNTGSFTTLTSSGAATFTGGVSALGGTMQMKLLSVGSPVSCFTFNTNCQLAGSGTVGMVYNTTAPGELLMVYGTRLIFDNNSGSNSSAVQFDTTGNITFTGLNVSTAAAPTTITNTALTSAALNCGTSNLNCTYQSGFFTTTFAGGGAGSIGTLVFSKALTNNPRMYCHADAFIGTTPGTDSAFFNVVPSGTTTTTLTFNLINGAVNTNGTALTVHYNCAG